MEKVAEKIDYPVRERLGSRLGFILLSAGCAIGLGNVWRFPFITGMYGGATFVIIYLIFLVIFGLPIMTMEFSVGRGSGFSVAKSFKVLEPRGTKWHNYSWLAMAGNYMLMMFYTTVSGWMLAYLFKMAKGDFVGLNADEVGGVFGAHTADPVQCVVWMVIVCALGFGVCAVGLEKSVERITKVMMIALLAIIVLLVVRSVTLPGASEGLAFYLMPSLEPIRTYGLWTVIYNAMGQSFFTLSLGIGSMAIFGSYIKKDRTLFGESLNVAALDTFVAFFSGLIIFPACYAFGVAPGAGPGLIFVTLPNIFNSMPGGQFWGTLFFVFMSFAALSTVIAVFENIIAFAMDLSGCSRRKASLFNFIAVSVLSLPCALGFNVWSALQPMGEGSGVLDLEDFILSNNLLPLGSMVFVLFCMFKNGWGWNKFTAEANTGIGVKFPKQLRFYCTYIMPLIILAIFVFGYWEKFAG